MQLLLYFSCVLLIWSQLHVQNIAGEQGLADSEVTLQCTLKKTYSGYSSTGHKVHSAPCYEWVLAPSNDTSLTSVTVGISSSCSTNVTFTPIISWSISSVNNTTFITSTVLSVNKTTAGNDTSSIPLSVQNFLLNVSYEVNYIESVTTAVPDKKKKININPIVTGSICIILLLLLFGIFLCNAIQ
ncbi:envelope glycoprotein [Harp seal herpesvirus]|uniref:Envelope glycoprotein n=1 Tax=phocid gammaherpesvirus 3 TaxID=2560643 RepID=A0A0R5Z6B8_9GAMA|nr:envelope glycoprotein [Harp seal herpesvirus]AJG42998.1 envelope glycoprotein [Harp seal herpesvirus]